MKTLSNIVIVGVLLFVVGCSSTSTFSFINEGVTAPTPTDAATITLWAAKDIGKPYIELGGVSVSIAGNLEGNQYANLLKKEAAKIGADAVVSVRQFGTIASGIAVKFQ